MKAWLTSALGFLAVATAALAVDEAPSPPFNAKISIKVEPPSAGGAPAASSDSWDGIKDLNFIMRAEFFATFARMETDLNDRAAKLASPPRTTREQTAAMEELESALAALKSVGAELNKAGPDTWGQRKLGVGQAWARANKALANATALFPQKS